MMEYIEKNQAKAFKVDIIDIETPFRIDEENIIISESRDVYFSRDEFIKAIQNINNKLNFHKYEIGEENINIIKDKIDKLEKKKKLFEDFSNKYLVNNQVGTGDQSGK